MQNEKKPNSSTIEKQLSAVEWFANRISHGGLVSKKQFYELLEQAKEMQDEQMQLTWNNAIDAVQKDKWHSYDEFYNNNFKSK